MAKYDALREKALANFELLINFWKLEYKKVLEYEYDILATWRPDNNYGSVRFNTNKGRGADFAGDRLTETDAIKLGDGFDFNDFVGYTEQGQSKIGFDIIGLCQRVYHTNTYQAAAEQLGSDLRDISRRPEFINITREAIERRLNEAAERAKKIKQAAIDLWGSSGYHKVVGSPGEKYLISRGITIWDKNIRVHPSITYGPLKKSFPALLFKVQESTDSHLQAIHRIFLTPDGKKADVDEPKMALASIKGAGIWFGQPGKTLYVAEGPENALTLRQIGANFVLCTVFSTNFHTFKLPPYVERLVLAPDPDPAGDLAVEKLLNRFANVPIKIEMAPVEKKRKKDGKWADLNDIYLGVE